MKRKTPGQEIIESLQELHDVLKSGEPLERHFTVRTVTIPDPTRYTPKRIKAARHKLGVSQALFAQILGVSRKLVEHWESGIRKPSPMASRLLDAIDRDPDAFFKTVRAA